MRLARLVALYVTLLLLLGVGVSFAQTASSVDVISNVEYGKVGDRALVLNIIRPKVLPKEPMPVVIWIHGGGWSGGNKESGTALLTPFAEKGYFCFSVAYRLSGEAIWPAQIQDCKCAIRWIRAHAGEYNIDPNRIGVWGGSAGGHLVALLGTTGGVRTLEGNGGWQDQSSRVQAVCDWYGPTDFMKMYEEKAKNDIVLEKMKDASGRDMISILLGGPFWELPGLCRQSSPLSYVSKDDPPFLIMHGDADALGLLSQSEMLDDALRKVGVESELMVMKGMGHQLFPVDPVIVFFDKCFRTSK